MERFVSIFTKQLKEAIEIGNSSSFNPFTKKITNVIISGLGGSGIGGKIVSELVQDELKVPVIINNNYFLPSFANEETLVIISSYSGNTEETVYALEQALEIGCEIACITSGGKVKQTAEEKGLNHIIIPGGNPPRSMLPYSLVQQFFILNYYNLISSKSFEEIEKSILLLDNTIDSIKTQAKGIAKKLLNKTTAIYADTSIGAVATRFKQQINENAKALCWDHVIPEMNHNELVGWAGGSNQFAAIFLKNETDFNRNQVRFNVSQEIIEKYTDTVLEIYSKGDTLIQKALYLILLTDWISVYLGNLKGVDTIEVDVISNLKEELSNI